MELFGLCPAGMECSKLRVECLNCTLNYTCVYGEMQLADCKVLSKVDCVVGIDVLSNFLIVFHLINENNIKILG